MKCVGTIAQEIGRAAAHDDGFAPGSDVLDDLLQGGDHLVGVKAGAVAERKGALVAAARVNFE